MVVGLDPASDIYVLDLWREHADSAAWAEALIDLMAKWKTITWAEEAGQIKNSVGPFITRRQLERKVYGIRRRSRARPTSRRGPRRSAAASAWEGPVSAHGTLGHRPGAGTVALPGRDPR
jgi:hypothetical protein